MLQQAPCLREGCGGAPGAPIFPLPLGPPGRRPWPARTQDARQGGEVRARAGLAGGEDAPGGGEHTTVGGLQRDRRGRARALGRPGWGRGGLQQWSRSPQAPAGGACPRLRVWTGGACPLLRAPSPRWAAGERARPSPPGRRVPRHPRSIHSRPAPPPRCAQRTPGSKAAAAAPAPASAEAKTVTPKPKRATRCGAGQACGTLPPACVPRDVPPGGLNSSRPLAACRAAAAKTPATADGPALRTRRGAAKTPAK